MRTLSPSDRRWLAIVLAGAGLVLTLSGCGAGVERASPQHFVVVLIDTLRADALGCYGNPEDVTPNLDALAAEGVRFDQAVSTSGWTLPAVGSLLTGAWPMIHGGMGKDSTLTPIREELPTAAEVLKEAGYNTFALANAAFVSPLLGLDRGFDVFDHRHAYNRDIRRADETVDAALALIREHRDEPTFVLVHLFDPHLDYDPPEDPARFTGGRVRPEPPLGMDLCLAAAQAGTTPGRPDDTDVDYIRGVYLAEVAFVDRQVGRLVDELQALGLWDRTTVVVTSDHGEEFWDHGGFEHGHTLYDELIRIPLIVRPAGGAERAGAVVDRQVRILDVMPTIFEWAGVPVPSTFAGSSLAPLLEGRDDAKREAFSQSTLYGPDRLAWRKGSYKLLYDADPEAERRFELYDLRRDPGERNDLLSAEPEVARRLAEELETFAAGLVERAQEMSPLEARPLGPREIERLRSLGYIR